MEPSGEICTSAWKFWISSSRAETPQRDRNRKTRSAVRNRQGRGIMVRRRSDGGCCGRIEADFGGFAFRGSAHFEELARFEAEHIRQDIAGKLLDFGVE